MGSGVSRRPAVNLRRVAITGDTDDDHPAPQIKSPLQVDVRPSSTQRMVIVPSSTPHQSLSRERSAFHLRPLPINILSPEPQNGNHVDRAETRSSSAPQLLRPTSTQLMHLRSASGDDLGTEMLSVDGIDESQREMFEHTAMSLGMDWDDFLFNVLYFGDGVVPDMSAAINNAREETVALHSENNTPYKLRPASTAAIEELRCETLLHLEQLDDPDCTVCKENIEVGAEVIFLPTCVHCFHKECLVRWIKLQGFCPVCRATIGSSSCLNTSNSKDTSVDNRMTSLRLSMAADTINEGDDDSKCSGYLDNGDEMLSYRENGNNYIEYDGLDDDIAGDNYHDTDGSDRFFEVDGNHIDGGYDEENDLDQVLQGQWGEEEYSGGGLSSDQGNCNTKGSARAESSADMDTENWLGSTIRSDVTIQYPEVSPLCGGKTVQRTTGECESPIKGHPKSQTNNPSLLL